MLNFKLIATDLGISIDIFLAIATKFIEFWAPNYSQNLLIGIKANDYPSIVAAAHKFKGAASNLRCQGICAALTTIEEGAIAQQEQDFLVLYESLQKELGLLQADLVAFHGEH